MIKNTKRNMTTNSSALSVLHLATPLHSANCAVPM